MTDLLLLRHCQASGQEPEAPLTAHGRHQAALAAAQLSSSIDHIVCSPFTRARQSVEPLAQQLRLPVTVDARLAERVLSAAPRSSWRADLEASFSDPELRFPGGESGKEATARALAALADVLASGVRAPLLVTHGNLLALILRVYQPSFGFSEWAALASPTLYRLRADGRSPTVEWLWSA